MQKMLIEWGTRLLGFTLMLVAAMAGLFVASATVRLMLEALQYGWSLGGMS